jgi:hypothetical protein
VRIVGLLPELRTHICQDAKRSVVYTFMALSARMSELATFDVLLADSSGSPNRGVSARLAFTKSQTGSYPPSRPSSTD